MTDLTRADAIGFKDGKAVAVNYETKPAPMTPKQLTEEKDLQAEIQRLRKQNKASSDAWQKRTAKMESDLAELRRYWKEAAEWTNANVTKEYEFQQGPSSLYVSVRTQSIVATLLGQQKIKDQELAKEFRGLAADWNASSVAASILSDMKSRDNSIRYEAKSEAFEQAAEMLEEKLS